MRYCILDGFRGFFIIFMTIVHVNLPLDSFIAKLNHHYFGWVEDAQGFVFISGIVVGLAYGGMLQKRSASAMRAAVWRRVGSIYLHQASLIALFLITALFLATRGYDPGYTALYAEEPFLFTFLSLILVTGSVNMGILPMYIVFLIATPPILVLMRNGHLPAIIVGSISLWLVAQLGLVDLVNQWAEEVAAGAGRPAPFGIFFNVLGWQLIYVSGLACGWQLVKGALDFRFLQAPQYGAACGVAVVAIIGLAVFDRVIGWELISSEYSSAFLAHKYREDFGPIYLVAFALDVFVITWLLVAGPLSRRTLIRTAADLVRRVFTHPALRLVGRHSLTLFSYHIVLTYGVRLAVGPGPVSQATGAVILLASAASLFAVALIIERRIPRWRDLRQQADGV